MIVDTGITPALVQALEQAIASGVLQVEIDNGGVKERITYQSIDDMIKAHKFALRRLDETASAPSRPVGSTLGSFARG